MGNSARLPAELRYDFDRAHDICIQSRQVTRGNPILTMRRTSHDVHIIHSQELGSNTEPQNIAHESRSLILRIPIARDLYRVFLRHHRIKTSAVPATAEGTRGSDQRVSIPSRSPDRPIKRCQFDCHGPRILADLIHHPKVGATSRVLSETWVF